MARLIRRPRRVRMQRRRGASARVGRCVARRRTSRGSAGSWPRSDADRGRRCGAAVEERRDELVALTQALVRVPTVNPPGENYREICELIAARLAAAGLRDRVRARRGRARATATAIRAGTWSPGARAARPGPCVHFNGHIDVVEVGQGWTTDPFGGALIDGRIYGRGTCDMKGGLAAAIVAVEAFLALAPGLRRRHRDLGDRRRGDRRLRRRRAPGAARAISTAGRPRHHPRAAEQGPGLPRPPRASGGPSSRPSGGSPTARCRSSATARCGTWAR